MEASMVEREGSTACSFNTPVKPVRLPFTLEIIMCLTLNSAAEWAGSRFQVVVEAGVAVVVAMGWLLSFRWMPQQDIRCNNYFWGRRNREHKFGEEILGLATCDEWSEL